MTVPNVVLNNGIEIPQVGFGVWRVPSAETQRAVKAALDAGYRHIDTAKLYDNEDGVGAAVRESGLDRDAVFVTSKVWNSDQGYDSTLRAFDATMDRLGFDVLDLYLIHWPRPEAGTAADTWRAMEKLYVDGRIRAIGVSNFRPEHLRRLLDTAEVVPAVNQVELHPYLQQAEHPRRERRGRDRHRGVGAARQGRRPAARPGRHRAGREARAHPGPGGAALAPPAPHDRDPEVGDALADRGEHRRLRLRPRRRGHGGDRRPRPRGPHRSAPGPGELTGSAAAAAPTARR